MRIAKACSTGSSYSCCAQVKRGAIIQAAPVAIRTSERTLMAFRIADDGGLAGDGYADFFDFPDEEVEAITITILYILFCKT